MRIIGITNSSFVGMISGSDSRKEIVFSSLSRRTGETSGVRKRSPKSSGTSKGAYGQQSFTSTNMTRSGILPDLFTLAEGKWTLIKPDGSREEVESDGTRTIDMRNYTVVMPILKRP